MFINVPTIVPDPALPAGSPPPDDTLDLALSYEDVRGFVTRTSHFRSAVVAGADPDDLVADIMVGLLVRQRGRGAFDPRRGSLRQYCWGVSRCVVLDRARAARRSPRVVPLDDAPDAALVEDGHREQDLAVALEHMIEDLALTSRERAMLSRLLTGASTREVRAEFGVRTRRVDGRRVPDDLQQLRTRLAAYLGAA